MHKCDFRCSVVLSKELSYDHLPTKDEEEEEEETELEVKGDVDFHQVSLIIC
jgi:hypothetical protein